MRDWPIFSTRTIVSALRPMISSSPTRSFSTSMSFT